LVEHDQLLGAIGVLDEPGIVAGEHALTGQAVGVGQAEMILLAREQDGIGRRGRAVRHGGVRGIAGEAHHAWDAALGGVDVASRIDAQAARRVLD
jgi:hypothetical protein